ncbi:MAG: tRNA (5-methylaminomethyl-2-thiouridine)(34)-methyltransferase MnmD [Saprospiraceae bacterium]|nr:tRNA (5-methylaminomethyl-2-thiouridine)(34)-methyltransferase MnmD [Saprospiraceae bacterium]
MSTEHNLSLVLTQDGSHTLYSSRFEDSYHSIHGAIQESRHIYIQAGLSHLHSETEKIDILEVGLGTGLNYLLTREYAGQYPELTLAYDAYEMYPVPQQIINQLNYGEFLSDPWFRQLHQLEWNRMHQLSVNFSMGKYHADIREMNAIERYNLIFFDAFAPEKQPEMWEEAVVRRIGQAAKKGAILVTYCSQGAFQRTLRSTGFRIEKLPGPIGKREILRAIKA